ncbi:MAG: MBOAT family protein [Verrucomicrobia bacterium]|nr:MBOAT family protein [Cytophagales bacterium]
MISEVLFRLFSYDLEKPMFFNTEVFWLFFTVFITIYAFIYKHRTARTFYVIAFSLFFYYKSGGEYVVILIASIILDYLIAGYIYHIDRPKERKFWLIFSIVANLSLLAYFKYTNFFLSNFAFLTGQEYSVLKIFLPIGISFYTFQTISYVVDVYQRKIAPAENLWDYAFYMTFFPHLVAGPIVRASHFLPQINRQFTLQQSDISEGLWLIVKGLTKKVVFGDFVGQYVNLVFAEAGNYSGFENLIAIYAYTLQIYCDFSGYSDMAMGFAKLMGFDLGINFNSPYKATSITDFWRRWHISLSSWLRDYVYIPLGGNREGKFRQHVNLFATMLIGGLWHGADWKFIFWGAMHGLALVVERVSPKFNFASAFWQKLVSGFLTFHLVALLWVFFRATSFADAILIIKKAFTETDLAYFVPFVQARGLFFAVLCVGFATHFLPEKWKTKLVFHFGKMPVWAKAVVFLLVFQLVLQIQSENVQPFIYFQF